MIIAIINRRFLRDQSLQRMTLIGINDIKYKYKISQIVSDFPSTNQEIVEDESIRRITLIGINEITPSYLVNVANEYGPGIEALSEPAVDLSIAGECRKPGPGA